MKVALSLLSFLAISALSQAMTTAPTTKHPHHGSHPPKPTGTREPAEKESYTFFYDHAEHNMVVHKGHMCYIAKLTADESTAVHTDSGIRSLELKLLTQLDSATDITGATDSLSNHTRKLCGKHATGYFTIP